MHAAFPRTATLFLTLSLSSCIVTEDAEVGLRAEGLVSTAFVHRGMTMVENGVLQGSAKVELPTKGRDGVLDVIAFGNVDLNDDTGDSWFPDGHAGKLTEIDFTAAYSEFFDDVLVTAGYTAYVLPNGTEFVFSPAGSERGETKELFVRAETEFRGVSPFGILHVDVDEANGFYARFGATKSHDFREDVWGDFQVALGVNDDNHAEWTYGVPDGGGGLADVLLTGRVNYQYDERSTFFGQLGLSQIVGSDIDDWMDLIGIESSAVWLSIGSSWTN